MSKRRLDTSINHQTSFKRISTSAAKTIKSNVKSKTDMDDLNLLKSTHSDQSVCELSLSVELLKWAKKCYISPAAMDDLLIILKQWHPELPSTYTELQTYSEAQGLSEVQNFDDLVAPTKENSKLSERLDRLEDMFVQLTNKVTDIQDTLEQQGLADDQVHEANASKAVKKNKRFTLKIDSKDELLNFDLRLETNDKAREELVTYLLGLGQFKTVGFYIGAIFKAIFTSDFLAQCRWNSLIALKETELARIVICVVMQVFEGNTERRVIDTISGVLRQFALHNKRKMKKIKESEVNAV